MYGLKFRSACAGVFALNFAISSSLAAQSAPPAPTPDTPAGPRFDVGDLTKPKSHFPNPFAPYRVRHLPSPGGSSTGGLAQLMRDGKVYLSINDAVALALENNLDLAIARFNMLIADTDIWRADAGSTITGVNSGVVQNTPGGGASGLGGQVGTGQGGTSIASGGAGAGAGGLVGSTLGTGAAVGSFDPIVTATLGLDHLRSECNSPLCATDENTASEDFTYAQSFHWGTDMSVAFDNSRVATNSPDVILSPALNSNFKLQLTQHLLQGFGTAVNTRYIQIARNNRSITDAGFRLQVTATVDQIENMYWDLVYAYENVKVQKEQMELARQTLENNKKQVEIGSLAPIEVVRAQSMIASDQQALTVALTNLELQQLLMKNALSKALDDPLLMDAEVIPTSSVDISAQDDEAPAADLVQVALTHRPELTEAKLDMENTEISKKAVQNALLPNLAISAFYGGAGLGGSQNPLLICKSDPGLCGLNGSTPNLAPVSYGSTLSQLFTSSAPDKGAVLSLTIPIRNRTAQASQVRSEYEYRQSNIRLQQLENQVRIEVRNAQFGVEQNRTSVSSAVAAVDFAQQSLDYEKRKFDLRASTTVTVLQNQAALVQAEATLVSAKVAYEKSMVELDRSLGLLLDHAGILIRDSVQGKVTQAPQIPHVSTSAAH